MRSRLFLALLAAVPVLCAASPGTAAAQRHHHRPARVYVYRDGRGYRDRIFIPARVGRPAFRRAWIGDGLYRDGDAYRDAGRFRRRVDVAELLLLAARARHGDGYWYRDEYAARTRGRCRHGGRHIRI